MQLIGLHGLPYESHAIQQSKKKKKKKKKKIIIIIIADSEDGKSRAGH
jgi:hypothetical protein